MPLDCVYSQLLFTGTITPYRGANAGKSLGELVRNGRVPLRKVIERVCELYDQEGLCQVLQGLSHRPYFTIRDVGDGQAAALVLRHLEERGVLFKEKAWLSFDRSCIEALTLSNTGQRPPFVFRFREQAIISSRSAIAP